MNFQPPKEISGSGVVAEWQQMAPVWPFQKNNEKSGPQLDRLGRDDVIIGVNF